MTRSGVGKLQGATRVGKGGLGCHESVPCPQKTPEDTSHPVKLTPLPIFSTRTFHQEGTWTSVTRRLSPANHCHQRLPARTPACEATLRYRGAHHQELLEALVHHLPGCLTHSGRSGPKFISLGFPLSFHFWKWSLGDKQHHWDYSK